MTNTGVGASSIAPRGRAASSRPWRVCVRHQIARHDGGGLCPQPACPCPDPIDHGSARAAQASVFTAADLPRIKPIRVISQAAGAKAPAWPPLATDKARYVGEAIAACIATSRGEAEDLAECGRRRFRGARRGGRRAARHARQPPLWSTSSGATTSIVERVFEGGDIEARGARGRNHGQPPIPHAPAVGCAARRPRRARLSRLPARRGRGLCLDPDAAHLARRIRRVSRHRGALHPGRGSRCRRRLRAQGAALSRKRSFWRHWRCSSITRCAGSRTAASTC